MKSCEIWTYARSLWSLSRRGFARFYSGVSRIIKNGALSRRGILLDVWGMFWYRLYICPIVENKKNILLTWYVDYDSSLCVLCSKYFQKQTFQKNVNGVGGWRPVRWSWIHLHLYINTGYIFVLIYWWLIYWRHDRKGDMKYMYSNVILFVIHYPQGRVIGRSSYARGATVLWFMVRKNSTFCWIRNLFHLWDKILSF